MTIERVKLKDGSIGVYRRCKKTLNAKIPNIDHLTEYERFWFLKHFYTDFANNTNRAYPASPIITRESALNAATIFTTAAFLWFLAIIENTHLSIISLLAGLLTMLVIIFLPIPNWRDPRDAFFKLNDVPNWKEYEYRYKETNEMVTPDVVAVLALQVTEEEYRYLKAIDDLDGRWYEGLIRLDSLKKAIKYAADYSKAEKVSSSSEVDKVEEEKAVKPATRKKKV